jgi:hypothetical protein
METKNEVKNGMQLSQIGGLVEKIGKPTKKTQQFIIKVETSEEKKNRAVLVMQS